MQADEEVLELDHLLLEDEEGNQFLGNIVDTFRYQEKDYIVLEEVTEEEQEEAELIFLTLEGQDEDGEELYAPIEDQTLLEEVFRYFKEKWEGEMTFLA